MVGVDPAGLIPPRPAWMAEGACRQHAGVDFSPAGEATPRRCSPFVAVVVSDGEVCLTYAQDNGECGVCGGQVLKRSARIGSWSSNLMTEYHVRYGGPGVMIYWHVERKSRHWSTHAPGKR